MKNIYVLLIFIVFLSFPIQNGYGQDAPYSEQSKQERIDGLSVYPNPVNNNETTIYITSNNTFAMKKVAVYNVLGKQIKATVTTRKELNISSLNSGVYILKITEGTVSETRKLVIK